MNSAIYTGSVVHTRHTPTKHHFQYPIFMMYLDLDELNHVFNQRWFWSTTRPALAWFRRTDHFGDPKLPLDIAVRDLVEERTGERPVGPIRMLTQLRHFGYCFNPVSFLFCFDSTGACLDTVLLEVNNTPWREQHVYILKYATPDSISISFDKSMHVSPFMDMDMKYVCHIPTPDQQLRIRMKNLSQNKVVFNAALNLSRKEITGFNLAKTLLAFPLMTQQTILRIYWQALRLWLKRVPFYTHPNKGTAS